MSKFIYLDSNFKELHSSIGKRIECDKKKCNHCCYNDSFLMQLFDKRGIRAIFNKIKSKEYNKVLPPEKGLSRPCPMLDLNTGKCSIYEDRPLPCRSYYSTSEKACMSLKEYNINNQEEGESDIKHQVLKFEKKNLIKILKAAEGSGSMRRDTIILFAEKYLKKNEDADFDSFYNYLVGITNSDDWKAVKMAFPYA